MTDRTTALVDAVLARGLAVKDRLDAGDAPDLDVEQTALRRMLTPTGDVALDPDFAGDAVTSGATYGGPAFLGLRYALACWLDELFILHTRWDRAWTERKLEENLYGTNDRAWRFWEQAAAADRRPDPGVLAAYLLCVALGFRGDYSHDPAKLAAWVAATREKTVRPPDDVPAPPARAADADVAPLRGRDEMRMMTVAAAGAALLALPVVAYLAVRRLYG